MKLISLAFSLCRVPAFGINDDLITIWPSLKEKISSASPSFYEQIAKVEADQICLLPEKIQFTIWKYFNRAKYRATPFANFASYTVVPVNKEFEQLQIENRMQSHRFNNWQNKDSINQNQQANLKIAEWLYSNNSAYQNDKEIRYLQLNEGTFELASVEVFPELVGLINFCMLKRDKVSVYSFMQTEYELCEKECEKFMLQLLELQLLHTDKTANITGEDYFTRLKLPINNEDENYILAERKLLGGSLAHSKSEAIAAALQFIAKLLPNPQNNDLVTFKKAFLRKFEHQHIPLSVVMDPEKGIGYGNLTQSAQLDELESLLAQKDESQPTSVHYTEMHQFLINGLMQGGNIAIEKFEPTTPERHVLPNTLSVICHLYKGNPVIYTAGGCTANALLGRFTLGSPELAAHCREIAELEQNANPDVLFFDIAYQAETRIDNVNRRKNCYAYELPILTWSCQAEPLDFNDIMVSVQASEIVLFSKKLGKRLIPRVASAYNYSRSDLTVYRFLCDLQHQSIQTNLTFDIQKYLPGLNHYPRISYKKITLSPAKWLIPKSIYQAKHKSQKEILAELLRWAGEKNVTSLVRSGISDQTLCFNLTNNADLIALLHHCKQQGDRSIYLMEALIDEDDCLIDENGKKHLAEYVINYHHSTTIYHAVTPPNVLSIAHKEEIKTHYLPGSEWLYYEIFVSPGNSNDLLTKQINLLLKTHKKDILMWFFIRYHEGGKHIRLRLKATELSKHTQIINSLNQFLATPMLNGVVSDVSIKTYYPEISRYGETRMGLVERFFCLDSKYVFSLIAKKPTQNQLYQLCIQFYNRMMRISFPLLSDRLSFAKQMAESFAAELNITQHGFKKINQRYAAMNLIATRNENHLKQLEHCAGAIFMLCAKTEKANMLADLIHMHVNRLFSDNQRLHEAVCYQFLYKQLLTEKRLVAQAERLASA